MSRKSDRLVKDLAALFVKYSIADWRPVIDELQKADVYRPLAKAIEIHLSVKSLKGRTGDRQRSKKKKDEIHKIDENESIPDDLNLFRDALIGRRLLSTQGELRMAAETLGMKDDLPADRRESIKRIINYLASLPQETLHSTINKLEGAKRSARPDQGSEFERWAALIMRPKDAP